LADGEAFRDKFATDRRLLETTILADGSVESNSFADERASPANLVAIGDSNGGGSAASRGPRALGAKIIQKC